MFSSKIKTFVIICACCLFFTTCKKYPENTLWFKDPVKLINNSWVLEKFTVNGFDSTGFDDLKMYREKSFTFEEDDVIFSEQYQGAWKLVNKKKYLEVGLYRSGNQIYYNPQKNIFRGYLKWKIEKLCNDKLWLSVISNDIKYEVHLTN